MSEGILVLVGNWGFHPGSRGISLYKYQKSNGSLEFQKTVFHDIEAGQMYVNNEKGMVYVVNEIGSRRGEKGGGGYVLVYKTDPLSGDLIFLQERETLVPFPSYLCMDDTGKYLLAAHHSDKSCATKVIRHPDGSFSNYVLSSDTMLVLFQILPDGKIGKIYDMFDTGNLADQRLSHLHSIVSSPGLPFFFVCDKGLDLIYTFQIDYQNQALHLLHKMPVEKGSMPRYSAVHPHLPLLYVNFEHTAYLDVFQYDSGSGKLTLLNRVSLLFQAYGNDIHGVGGTDILLHPSGKTLYVAICGVNQIAVLDVLENGTVSLKQNIACGGMNPRGLCLSPDGRYLYVGNMLSGNISLFKVERDGYLSETGRIFPAVSPSVIRFAVCHKEGTE